MAPPKRWSVIASGNYVSRSDGATYVTIGDVTVYFSEEKVIALVIGDTLYRTKELDSGIVYKRLRSALLRHKAKNVMQITRDDLHHHVEAAILQLATALIDEKLTA